MATKAKREEVIVVDPPRMGKIRMTIQGTAPFVQHKFPKKAREIMRLKQEGGDAARNKRKREGKDFDAEYEGAMHKCGNGDKGWHGIPATAFRAAMISACRVAGIVMTKAKLTVFVLPDGFDDDDGTPLCRITKGKPIKHETTVRLETGVADVRVRPMWREGWEAAVLVQWDQDQMTRESVVNLMARAGMQVGVGEGRPDSKKSAGQGWGTFIVTKVEDMS